MSIGNQPSGYKVSMAIAKEVDYGVAPTEGYTSMLFTRDNVGSENSLERNPSLGQGRDAGDPIQNPFDVGGQIGFVLDPRRIGIFLTGLLGAPTSTDQTTHWEHEFKTGKDVLPSYSLEYDLGLAAKFKCVSGVGIDAIDFSFQRSGFATATVDVIGQKESINAALNDATPDVLTDTPFSNYKLSVKQDGVVVGDIISGSLRYANNLERQEHIRGDGFIDGLSLSQASLSGNLTVRFKDMSYFELATNGTPISLEFAYEISETLKMVIAVHRVFLPKGKIDLDGPSGIDVPFAWEASLDTDEDCAMTITLFNDVDDTVY